MKVARTAPRLLVVLVVVSIALVVADGVIYLALIYGEDEGGPAWWFVVGLFVVIMLGLGTLWREGLGSVVMGIAWLSDGQSVRLTGYGAAGDRRGCAQG
jgi:hypothetical protein